MARLLIPQGEDNVILTLDRKDVRLTNLRKIFWPEPGLTKGDLLQYYADIADALLPHLRDRAMVMKRYPHGAHGEFFFMKRAPSPRPPWIQICSIDHGSSNVIDFPMIQDRASLLWVINLGCIDLNQWYARCDDVDRPDYLHFDLDPGGASFDRVRESALVVREALETLKMPAFVKTTGSKGMHVYVPIVRGPEQKAAWTFAKALAQELAARNPALLTAEYRVAKRPRGRVLVDYNQNAWGRTLASIYSVRPRPDATVSTPVTWKEVERGVRIEDFSMLNVPARVRKIGDLWKPLLAARGRFDLRKYLVGACALPSQELMHVREFDFDLPAELIAQAPSRHRGEGRLLHLSRSSGVTTHTRMAALPEFLEPGDLLVVNDTRVFPARLLGRRVPSGGAVECLLIGREADPDAPSLTPPADPGTGVRGDAPELKLEPTPFQVWEALMHPGQKLRPGARVIFEGSAVIHGEVLERRFHGRRLIRLWTDDGLPLDDAVDAIGHVPLPPYIKRPDRAADRERYQTVFARQRGSVAAPTAGLHLSEALLEGLSARGVATEFITLHVGYGTFQPVRVEQVEDHRVEPERYRVGPEAAAAINRALSEGRRVIAVGTTTTRTLEAVALANDGRMAAGAGTTDLFIHPPFGFRVIKGLLTNFHLPQSSLLMLVSAFAGREPVMAAYREAIAGRYQFYSYGEAMLVL